MTLLMFGIVMSGKYWTFEKVTLFFCLFNLVYIPAAIWAMQTGNVAEGWAAVGHGFYSPSFRGILPGTAMITLIMANIGTTITPWQIFFQQSAVVDKGMDVRDIKAGKIDTFFGSFLTCMVAAFIVIAAAGVFYYNPANPPPAVAAADKEAKLSTAGPWQAVDPELHSWRDVDSAAKSAEAMPAVMPNASWGQWAKVLFAIGLFDAGLLGALCISLATSWAVGEVFGWAHSLQQERARGALVLRRLPGYAHVGRSRFARGQHGRAKRGHDLCPGRGRDPAAGGPGVPDSVVERQAPDGKVRQHAMAKLRQLGHCHFCHRDLHGLCGFGFVSRVVLQIVPRVLLWHRSANMPKNPDSAGPAKDYRFHYFSQLLNRPVCAGKIKNRIGRLTDLVFRLSEPYPEAVGVYLEHGWGKPTEFIPWDRVVKIDNDAVFVQPPEGEPVSALRRSSRLDAA